MSLMWLLATIHLHWLKDATLFWWIWLHLVLKTSLTTIYLILDFFCQCAGAWHFPWSRNACGIYWSLQLYIPNTCMPCRIFGYFLLPSDDTTASESWSVTALTQCTCQASAVTLCFSQWLFNSPLTRWHFRWDRPFFFSFFLQHSLRLDSLSFTITSLPHRSSVQFLNSNTAPKWNGWALPVGTLQLCGQIVSLENFQTSIQCISSRLCSLCWIIDGLL